MKMFNDFHLKAMLFGLKRSKTEYRIAVAEQKTLLEIKAMYHAGMLTHDEVSQLLDEMWGDING